MISQGFILIHYTQLADGLLWKLGKTYVTIMNLLFYLE